MDSAAGSAEVSVASIRQLPFMDNIDERGRLTAVESGITVPFPIRRIFYVHQVQPGEDRGGHAHRDTDQVLTALGGALDIVVSDAEEHRRFRLDDPGFGIYMPRMIWVRMYNFSPGCSCVVFASTHYDRSRSVRTWAEYLEARGKPWRLEPTLTELDLTVPMGLDRRQP